MPHGDNGKLCAGWECEAADIQPTNVGACCLVLARWLLDVQYIRYSLRYSDFIPFAHLNRDYSPRSITPYVFHPFMLRSRKLTS